jgi:hypothetical protein
MMHCGGPSVHGLDHQAAATSAPIERADRIEMTPDIAQDPDKPPGNPARGERPVPCEAALREY